MLVAATEAVTACRHALLDHVQQVVDRFVAGAGDGNALTAREQIADHPRADRGLAASRRALHEKITVV